MTTNILKEILIEHKKAFLHKNDMVCREKLSELVRYADMSHVTVVTGVRRCGKSSLLSLLAKKLIDAGIASVDNILYVNYEDEKFIGFEAKNLNLVLEAYYELNPGVHGRVFLFFDEIQQIEGWERFVNRLHSEKKYKIYVTGSNAKLLSEEIASSLTGRSNSVELMPFDFEEFLRFKNVSTGHEKILDTKDRALMKNLFNEYLNVGGFPEQLQSGKDMDVLQELYKNILHRDIIARYGIKNVTEFREFAHYVISNIASLHGYSSLARAIPSIKSINTARRYFQYLGSSFLCFGLPFFSASLKSRARNPMKVYAIDNGLYQQVSFRLRDPKEKLFENYVYLELRRRKFHASDALFYFKKNKEVDFVASNRGKIELIQVSCDVSNQQTREREESALLEAMDEFGIKHGLILCPDSEQLVKHGKSRIQYHPIWKWALNR